MTAFGFTVGLVRGALVPWAAAGAAIGLAIVVAHLLAEARALRPDLAATP